MKCDTPITVAVVDDDDDVRDSLRALLEERGFAVLDFASAFGFLAWQDRQSLGCLLLDVHMPEMTGVELLGLLRQKRETLPTILLSGRLQAGIEQQAKELGVVAVLAKPVAPPLLLTALDGALS